MASSCSFRLVVTQSLTVPLIGPALFSAQYLLGLISFQSLQSSHLSRTLQNSRKAEITFSSMLLTALEQVHPRPPSFTFTEDPGLCKSLATFPFQRKSINQANVDAPSHTSKKGATGGKVFLTYERPTVRTSSL